MNFSTFVFFIVWPWYEFLYQILHYTQIPVYVLMQLFVVSVQHLLCILIYCIIDIFLALKSVKKCMWVFRVHKIMCIRVMHFFTKKFVSSWIFLYLCYLETILCILLFSFSYGSSRTIPHLYCARFLLSKAPALMLWQRRRARQAQNPPR